MREGLRFRTRLGKDSGAGVVERGRVEKESFDLNVEGSSASQDEVLNVTAEKKEEVECAVKKECGFDLNESPSGNPDLANDVNDKGCSGGAGGGSVGEADVETEVNKKEGNNKDCFSGGGSIKEAEFETEVNKKEVNDKGCSRGGGSVKEADVEREVNKKEGSNDSVLIAGRVLRSRSKRGDDTKSCNGENSSVLPGKSNKSSGLERIEVKKEYDEADEFVSDCHENEKVKLKKKGRKSNLKRKRGRPPKIEPEEEDQFVDRLPRKRGRPPIIRSNEQDQSCDQLIHRRGRPPKAGLQNQLPKMVNTRKGKVDSAIVNAIPDTYSGRASEKDLENQGFSPVKNNKVVKVLKTENNGVASPVTSNTVKAPVADKSVSNKERWLVREQIMERLSAAGWTVDYRKRKGKEYHDAVYVSLDGKTHWSITFAYNRLKTHYETGDGEGKVYGPGFKFNPIPEEDYKILTKVISKERKDNTIAGEKRGCF